MEHSEELNKPVPAIEGPQSMKIVCNNCKSEGIVELPSNFILNIIGLLQFRCKCCGVVINSQELWSTDMEKAMSVARQRTQGEQNQGEQDQTQEIAPE